MEYQSIAGTFGCLENKKLTLPRGFSVLLAENETGKSTWCALLTALLYGVSTSERRRDDFLPDKLRFEPWSGRPAFGRLTLTHQGETIEIHRNSTRSGILQEFSALYAGTGQPVPHLSAQTAGESLTGVSKDVFVRSAFYSGNMAVSQSAALEQRITALAGTGEEEVSASAVSARLGQWANERQYQKRGRMPVLAKEIEETKETLAAVEAASQGILAQKRGLLAFAAEENAAKEAFAAAKTQEKAKQLARLAQAREDLAEKTAAAENIREEFGLFGAKADPALLLEVEEAFSLSQGRAMEARLAETDRYNASLRLAEWTRAESDSPFANLSAEYAAELAQKEYETATAERAAKPALWPFGAGLALITFAALLYGFRFFPGTAGVVMPLFFLVFGIAGVFLGIFNVFSAKKRKAAAKTLCARYNATDPEGILAALAAYQGFVAESRARRRALEETEQTLEQANTKAGLVASRAKAAFNALSLDENDDPKAALAKLSQGQQAYAAAASAAETAKQRLAIWEEEAARLGVATELPKSAAPANLSVAEAETALQTAKGKRSAAETEYARLEGRLSHYPDKAALAAKISAMEEEYAALAKEYDALVLARSVVNGAAEELSRRLTPKLTRRAGEIFRRFTGNRYDDVRIEKNWQASVIPGGENASKELRELLYLSAGAADQLYLSLRLALSEVVFENAPPPLILDDPFAAFDDKRVDKALALLAELAETRQVVLFSCRENEAAMAFARGALPAEVGDL